MNANKPKLGPLADQLAHLASYLTEGDRQLCRLLAEHHVLTATHCAQLVYGSAATARYRLAQLTKLRVTDRFRPRPPTRRAGIHHYVLGETGAAVLAAEQGKDPTRLTYRREQVLAIAYTQPQLTRLLAINTFFAHLAAAARADPAATLVAWRSSRRCADRWGALIRPDAYGRWRDGPQEVDFFVHCTIPDPVAATITGYEALAVHTRRATPVLFWLPTPAHETQLRAQLGQPLVPVATAAQPQGSPAEAVWQPHRPGSPRQRLAGLGHPAVWQPVSR